MPFDIPEKDEPEDCPICDGWGVYSSTRIVNGSECFATIRCTCPAGVGDDKKEA